MPRLTLSAAIGQRRIRSFSVLLLAMLVAGAVSYAIEMRSTSAKTETAAKPVVDKDRSIAAFRQVAAVLRHPRCINCHTATDFPRQGNDHHPHLMNVRRGGDDHGVPAMRCNSCHQDFNQLNGVPGAPKWGLAPLAMKWEGLNDHELAEALKDPARNGRRSLEEMAHHMAHDELVGWGWHPGAARDAIPVSREEFVKQLRLWIETGAVSPER